MSLTNYLIAHVMHVYLYTYGAVRVKHKAIATGSLPVQRIVEDCSGRTSSGFSLAPNYKHTDATSLRSSEN